jgi:murein DD-endopeptidase MepM/ murein hydrolase activator NlpD
MLHAKLGLPLPDEASRKLSTGGHIEPNVQLLRKTSPVFERTAKMHEDVWRLYGQIQNNEESFNALTKYIDQSRSVLRYIPSISPTNGRYASAFGPRIHPVTGEIGKMHQGIDISNDRWTPIYAPADGVVEISQLSSSFGNFVVLNHGNGLKTRYGHMQMSAVTPGEFVHRYQILGYMGNTGRSVGPHLHYEVWKNGVPVNPLPYILPNDYEVD